MSNRTKIKIRAPKPEKIVVPPPIPPKKLWQPPQSLLGAVIFLALGAAIFGKSLYVVIPAGLVLLGLLAWSGVVARYSGAGSKVLRSIFLTTLLIITVLAVRIYLELNK